MMPELDLELEFALEFTSDSELELAFEESSQSFEVNVGEVQEVVDYVGEPYEGDYEVTPKTEEQIMPTKDKLLLEDMSVKAIPFFKVSNNSGGTTVFIGSEV